MRRLLVVALVAAACGGGAASPPAPTVAGVVTSCGDDFCLTHPDDWIVEEGGSFLRLTNPASPEAAASVGSVDMGALVEAVGGTWPTSPRTAVEAFWELIGGGEDAVLEMIEVRSDRSVRSEGRLGDVRLWHRLVPVGGRRGIGVEMRGPDRGWAEHAEVILEGLETSP